MSPDFFVLSVEVPEGERFAIVSPGDMPRPGRTPSDSSQWLAAFEAWVRSLGLLTEPAIRSRLESLGVTGAAASEQIAKARRTREMNTETSWERVTAIGYRNVEGQQVVAKTVQTGGDPAQRVFLLRCIVCGHEYRTLGCEIPHRCCPNCQDGEPGLATP